MISTANKNVLRTICIVLPPGKAIFPVSDRSRETLGSLSHPQPPKVVPAYRPWCKAPRHVAGRRPEQSWCVADRKSTRLNSSHGSISYAVFCLKKKKNTKRPHL